MADQYRAGQNGAGNLAVGLIAMGAISVGLVSLGALAVGEFSAGAMAIGDYLAIGDSARAAVAVGKTEAYGCLYQKVGELSAADYETISELLKKRGAVLLFLGGRFCKAFPAASVAQTCRDRTDKIFEKRGKSDRLCEGAG